jgi:hypothetical protein
MSPDIFSSEFKSFPYRSKDQMIYSVLQTTRDSNNKPRYYYYYYHCVNLAISSAKRHVTNTADIINAAARGNAHKALLDNRHLTAVWDIMSSYAPTMGLTPMTTHYLDLLNYDANFIRRRMDEGNIDVTVYVSVPLTGPDAVMQVYMYTGMPFPVKLGFFVNIESEFQYIVISKGDLKFRAKQSVVLLTCWDVYKKLFPISQSFE